MSLERQCLIFYFSEHFITQNKKLVPFTKKSKILKFLTLNCNSKKIYRHSNKKDNNKIFQKDQKRLVLDDFPESRRIDA